MRPLTELSLFALAPSVTLGRMVAELASLRLVPHEVRRFEDGEHKIRPLSTVRGHDVYIVCSLYGDAKESVNDRLCQLLFFIGALRDAGAGRISVVAPYLCYARKDRRTNARDPVTTRYVATLFEAAGADRVVTIDVHNRAAFENAFRIPTEHLEATSLFVRHCGTLGARGFAVVSPDPGGFHRAEAMREMLERATGTRVELAMLGKHRKGGVVTTEGFVGDVAGKTAVIIDDMIVTGTTLIRAAEACRERGAIGVHAMATHGVFSAAAGEVLASPAIESVVISDTVDLDRVQLGAIRAKLSIVSVAPLLASTVCALHRGASMTEVAYPL